LETVSHSVLEIQTGFVHARTSLPYMSFATCLSWCLPQGLELAVYTVNEAWLVVASKTVVKALAKVKVEPTTVRLFYQ